MRHDLRFVDGMQLFLRLAFDDELAFDKDIRPEAAFELDAFIHKGIGFSIWTCKPSFSSS